MAHDSIPHIGPLIHNGPRVYPYWRASLRHMRVNDVRKMQNPCNKKIMTLNVALLGISARVSPYWPEGLMPSGQYGDTWADMPSNVTRDM